MSVAFPFFFFFFWSYFPLRRRGAPGVSAWPPLPAAAMAMAARRRFAALFDPNTPPSSDADTDEESELEADGGTAAAAAAAAMTAADARAVLAAPLAAAGEPTPPSADLANLPARSVAAALMVDAAWPPREESVWAAVRRWAAAAAGVPDDATAAEPALWSPAQRSAVTARLRPLLSPDGGGGNGGGDGHGGGGGGGGSGSGGGCVRLLDLPLAVMASVERLGDPDPAELLAYYRYHALVAEEAAAQRRRSGGPGDGCGVGWCGRGWRAAAAAAATVAVVDRYYGHPPADSRPFDRASLRRRLRAAVVAVESAHPLPAGAVILDPSDDDNDDLGGGPASAAGGDQLIGVAKVTALPPGARRLGLPPWASAVRLVVDARTKLPAGVALRFYGPAFGARAGGRLPPGWVGTRTLRSPVLGYGLVSTGGAAEWWGGEAHRTWGYAFTLEPLFCES